MLLVAAKGVQIHPLPDQHKIKVFYSISQSNPRGRNYEL